ncbi:hypothetical protein RF11_04809 [Thelohanellus kitauei]|uniref:Uncharacterized protein n=1 Tax=Thelohanellus kitauei TaxID=669202 RepID=A0A0C2M7K8_THEKT|nr:hypothetical protein RF11_04809 [Thelohanellus kitauei]
MTKRNIREQDINGVVAELKRAKPENAHILAEDEINNITHLDSIQEIEITLPPKTLTQPRLSTTLKTAIIQNVNGSSDKKSNKALQQNSWFKNLSLEQKIVVGMFVIMGLIFLVKLPFIIKRKRWIKLLWQY